MITLAWHLTFVFCQSVANIDLTRRGDDNVNTVYTPCRIKQGVLVLHHVRTFKMG